MLQINEKTKKFLEEVAQEILDGDKNEITKNIPGTKMKLTLIRTEAIDRELIDGQIISEELFFHTHSFHLKGKKASHS